MKIVVDSNIVFSCLLKSDTAARDFIFEERFQLFAPNFLATEIFKHKEKIVMKHVTEIIEAKPFQLKLKFDNNEILNIDLEQRLISKSTTINSVYKKLLDPQYFVAVKLNKEMQSIYWDNGVDFCSDVLYMMGKKIKFEFNDNKKNAHD